MAAQSGGVLHPLMSLPCKNYSLSSQNGDSLFERSPRQIGPLPGMPGCLQTLWHDHLQSETLFVIDWPHFWKQFWLVPLLQTVWWTLYSATLNNIYIGTQISNYVCCFTSGYFVVTINLEIHVCCYYWNIYTCFSGSNFSVTWYIFTLLIISVFSF